MPMIDFRGQVVLVTGAGRGLGAAYARLIASRGAVVAVHDAGVGRDGTGADPGPARGVRDEVVSHGGTASAHVQDLATRGGCEDLVTEVIDLHGRMDAMVHNAGIVRYLRIAETSEAEWRRTMAVNVEAAWWLCRAVWPTMVEQGYGRLVLTVSGYGLKVVPGADVAAYSISKAAQFGLMNALAGDGQDKGILVNAVSPIAATRIFRRQTAPGELTPESVAPGVAVLASRDCPVTGTVLTAAGGQWGIARWQPAEEIDLGSDATPDDLLTWLRAAT
jgi:NAD(P)-dependent dehydrogenase (short-subunit alcohol dehydrogenase family)